MCVCVCVDGVEGSECFIREGRRKRRRVIDWKLRGRRTGKRANTRLDRTGF